MSEWIEVEVGMRLRHRDSGAIYEILEVSDGHGHGECRSREIGATRGGPVWLTPRVDYFQALPTGPSDLEEHLP